MMTVIIGGSGSGKSAYAEDYITKLAGKTQKYYLATMQVWDEEGRAKIEKHRKMRAGKGFITIEQPTFVEEALKKICSKESAVLLECMSNLAANEMFSRENIESSMKVTDKIIRGMEQIKENTGHLVIVTNNVFEDGVRYDDTTMEYIAALGHINEKLAAMADEVIEVVVGIPVVLKKGR